MKETSHNRKPFKNNAALAQLFHRMSDCYRYLGSAERFRAIAYENAARVLRNMQEDIADYATDIKSLDEIGGIGESIARKIIEFLQTGRVRTFEKLKKQVPYELLELMDISGFGPATLQILHDQLGIRNREELVQALETGKLAGLKGFGQKKIENMQRALKILKTGQRLPLRTALKIGQALLQEIKNIPGVQKAELAGSLRRKKDTIGDIDIIILADTRDRKKIVNRFITLPQVHKVLAKGTTRASVVFGNHFVQVDIRLVHDYEYGAAMLYFTGSKEHNIRLRTMARNRGYKINEYGIFDAGTGQRLAGETEEEMYRFMGLAFIPPEERLDKGEIEKAVLAKKQPVKH